MAIRVYLEDILKDRGLTSKELCAKVGITEANLSILRSGKAKGVRFATINRICYFILHLLPPKNHQILVYRPHHISKNSKYD